MKGIPILLAALLLAPALAAGQGPAEIELTSCRDLMCTNRTDIFLVGEGAYIDYNSTVKGITYTASLTYPNGTGQPIIFPNRIVSNVSGNYTVEMVIWEGDVERARLSKVVQFMEKLPEQQAPSNPPRLDWLSYIIIAVVIGILGFSAWKFFRKNPDENKQGKQKS